MVVWARQIVHTGQSGQDVWEGYTPIFLRDGLQVLDDNRAGETPHYSMMFEEPQAFASVMDLINDGEFGAVEWEGETTYDFVGVSEIENVRVSNYVYQGVIIEKEYVIGNTGFGPWSNTENGILVHDGKLVVKDQYGQIYTQIYHESSIQNLLNNDAVFGDLAQVSTIATVTIDKIRNEAGVQMRYPDNCILYDQVPVDAELYILPDERYYRNQ